MITLIIFFLISILFSFLCSIWEAVLLSITPSYIASKEEEGGVIAEKLIDFKNDIDKPLSAILTLNTIAHTAGAIGVGAQAGKIFGENYFSIVGFELSYESIIAAVMTLAILVLSEIIPKTIGANNWKSLAPFTITSLNILVKILFPFVWMSQLITGLLKKNKKESVLSRSDFAVLAKKSVETGSLLKDEHIVIDNLLRLNELKVEDVMTPRSVMFVADATKSVKDFYDKHEHIRFSRIPIFNQEKDNVIGFVLKDDVLEELLKGSETKQLSELKRNVSFVLRTLTLRECMHILQDKSEHVLLVNDKHGSLVGIVTMEDIIETLLGIEIVDESDDVANLQLLARKKWEARAKKMGLID